MDTKNLYQDSKHYFDRMTAHQLHDTCHQADSLIRQYIETLQQEFEQTLAEINGKNFWSHYPILMGLDARFVLLDSLLALSDIDLTEQELIQMVEKDYVTINKEFCGYTLNEKPHESLFFAVT